MTLTSDVVINASKFDPSAISDQTSKLNDYLVKVGQTGPQWYEVGAPKYREMRANGQTSFPKPTVLESGKYSKIPSRDQGRDIPTRVFTPEKGESKGVFMHIHGGGWVLSTEQAQDPYLKFLSDSTQLTVISVGYRLAPEHPFPAGPNDCYDVAEYLVDNAEKEHGGPMRFVSGDSAGGHMSALVCLHLLKARPSFAFAGVIFHFGAFDLSGLPQTIHFTKPLILDHEIMDHFTKAFLPNTTVESRRSPDISPFYANLREIASHSDKGELPPALFTCGTEDCLLDDTMMMSVKWQMTGAEAVVKIFTGAPHGFTAFPPDKLPGAGQALADMKTFMLEKLA